MSEDTLIAGEGSAGVHCWPLRVYYEDTDLAGIVYYANYLKFIERARTEWVRAMGIDQMTLKDETGIVFAVRRIEADYLSPARFDDEVVIRTSVASAMRTRIVLRQDVTRADAVLFVAMVTLVALDEKGRAVRLPAALTRRLG